MPYKGGAQVIPDLLLELLCKHIPDRYEHLVRCVGWYSNRARCERVKALSATEASEGKAR